jgi:DNA-binding NarL/FixJ family response regulator
VIRVLLADDHQLIRAGFRMVLDGAGDISVVAEAADGAAAVRLAVECSPDVVLMDVRMPVMDGLEATRRIVAAGGPTKVIVLTTYDVDDAVHAALRAGASGFLLKDARPGELVDAVRVVVRGDALLAPSVTRRLLERFAADPPPDPAAAAAAAVIAARAVATLSVLTPREVEILRLLATALSNSEIAERLVLSEATVKTHVSSVLRKLQLRDRIQAVVLGYDTGLVHPRRA